MYYLTKWTFPFYFLVLSFYFPNTFPVNYVYFHGTFPFLFHTFYIGFLVLFHIFATTKNYYFCINFAIMISILHMLLTFGSFFFLSYLIILFPKIFISNFTFTFLYMLLYLFHTFVYFCRVSYRVTCHFHFHMHFHLHLHLKSNIFLISTGSFLCFFSH